MEKVSNATAEMLILELYSKLDDKEYRKECVKGMIDALYENKKISNAVYEEALNILDI